MNYSSQRIQYIYLFLMLLNTLAASFIWGINTLFLLDAGLSNTEAFAANALFTAGQVLFEVPTGIVADTWGRRTSYLLGTLTLSVSTVFYLWAWHVHAPFWGWAVSSILLGLGFTFFSGATEAWLVDALEFTKFKGGLESVFAKGQIVSGVAMLTGSVAGGLIAQTFDLGAPYIIRSALLAVTFVVAYVFMKDLGFTPQKGGHPWDEVRKTFTTSLEYGLRKRSIRWIMLEAPFSVGVSYYAFYAMQPHLLKLYGNKEAYGVAGLAAAIVAGAQIAGGFAVPYVKKVFVKRTSLMLATTSATVVLLIAIGFTNSFAVAVVLLVLWGLVFAARMPVRQAYLNELIQSKQRATVLSFDALMGSAGGVVTQPSLGGVADAWGYPWSYAAAAAFQVLSVPFILLARGEKAAADNTGSVKAA